LIASTSSATTDDPAGAPAMPGARAEHVVFEVEGRTWACDAADVREVLSAPHATRIPGAPAHVRGLVNVRGGVLTVVDLAMRLASKRPGGADRRDADGDRTILLAHALGRRIGILVDDVHDVRSVEMALVDRPSGDFGPGGIVRGVGRIGDDVVGVIDVAALVRETLV
jgi:purine-binding chemotaxis protein CheW